MKSTDWKAIAESIGVAAIVGSLIFVGVQLRQDQRIAEAQIYADSNLISIELANLVNENRDVWMRGLVGEELDEVDEVTFQNVYMAIQLAYGGIWQRANRLSTRSPEGVARQFAYLLYVYPGFRRVWESRSTFERERNAAYGGQFPAFNFAPKVREFVEELDSGRASIPEVLPFTPW